MCASLVRLFVPSNPLTCLGQIRVIPRQRHRWVLVRFWKCDLVEIANSSPWKLPDCLVNKLFLHWIHQPSAILSCQNRPTLLMMFTQRFSTKFPRNRTWECSTSTISWANISRRMEIRTGGSQSSRIFCDVIAKDNWSHTRLSGTWTAHQKYFLSHDSRNGCDNRVSFRVPIFSINSRVGFKGPLYKFLSSSGISDRARMSMSMSVPVVSGLQAERGNFNHELIKKHMKTSFVWDIYDWITRKKEFLVSDLFLEKLETFYRRR